MIQTTQQNVPSLRFPEFSGEWNSDTLGSYYTFKNGVNADKTAYGKGHKFINVLDIISDLPITSDRIIGCVDISGQEFEKNEVCYGDILFQRSSETREEVGQSNVYLDTKETATFGGFVIRGKPQKGQDPKFFHYLLKTSKVRQDMTSRSGGSTRYNVGQKSLSLVSIALPTAKDEQQKIAAFFGAVDEKIALLSRKKELLEEYKKGCMQQIFSQQIRFRDDNGTPYPDWEEKRLGDIGEVRTSSVDKISRTEEKSVKLLNYMDVYRRDQIRASDDFQKITAPDAQILSANLLMGDVLFTPSSETPTDIGHSAVAAEDLPGVLFSYHLVRFRPIQGVLLAAFSGYAFKSDKFYMELWKRAQGATRYTISKSALEESTVIIPKSIEEQQKIAHFLSDINKKIDHLDQEFTLAKAFRQGLLQQMFV